MEAKRERQERPLKRCYQCSRLHDQLWDQAYEQIWPLVRIQLIQRRDQLKEQPDRSHVRAGG